MDPVYNRAYFGPLPVPVVAQRWPELRELFEKAATHGRGEVEVDDVLKKVQSAEMIVHALLVPPAKIALAVASRVSRARDALEVVFVAGRGGIHVLAERIEEFYVCAKILGVRNIRCWCRPAVARYLRRHLPGVILEEGPHYVTVTKEVPA